MGRERGARDPRAPQPEHLPRRRAARLEGPHPRHRRDGARVADGARAGRGARRAHLSYEPAASLREGERRRRAGARASAGEQGRSDRDPAELGEIRGGAAASMEASMSAETMPRDLLWVDDDDPERFVFERFVLQKDGWNITWARDVVAAAKLLEGQRFDALILDQMIAGDGVEEQAVIWSGCHLLR